MIAERQIAFGKAAAKKEEPPAYWGLCFTAEAANSSVQLTAVGSPPAVTLVKSFDGINWEAYAVGEVIDLPSTGDLVYLAAGEGGNESFGSSTSEYHKFVINGLVAASGDITSLRRFDLEQTTLAASCYASMFNGCTGLTSAPELPATKLAGFCYYSMFSGCINMALIKVYFTEWSSRTNIWVNGVSPTGTFICPTALGTNETIKRGASYCPEGWTVINED